MLLLCGLSDANARLSAPDQSSRAPDQCSDASVWVEFGKECSAEPPHVEVLESSQTKCTIKVTTFGMHVETVKWNQQSFQKLSIPSCGFTSEVGKPQLPIIRGLVKMPYGKKAQLKVADASHFDVSGYMVYPVQEHILAPLGTFNASVTKLNTTAYALNEYYPEVLASIEPPARLRDHTVLSLTVFPIRFNPSSGDLRVYTQVMVELSFCGGDKGSNSALRRLSSPPFDKICEAVTWNFDSHSTEVSEENVGYLIITNDSFCQSLASFIEWKSANGLLVTCVNLSDIGSNVNATHIRDYIGNAFHNWTVPPTYILLVGDSEYLPAGAGAVSQHMHVDPIPTDNYFACVEGDDYFPDVILGRLSVRNTTELDHVLDKIMGYGGFTQATAVFMAGGGFETECEWHYNYVTSQGYDTLKLYENLGTATLEKFKRALQRGAIVFVFSHGDPTDWETTGFNTSDVYSLNPVYQYAYPIVLSCSCLTGRFANPHGWFPDVDCLGEAFMKAPDRGAVGFLGATDIASADLSDVLFRGFFKGIFEEHVEEFGALMVAAKLYLNNYYIWHYNLRRHFDLYNIFTDPQLELRPFRTREVPTEYSTIQQAVNHARNGETILVRNGTYFESVVINKTLSIIGEDKLTTQLCPSGKCFAVNITANGVHLSGFTIQGHGNSSFGIYMSSSGNSISDNIITNHDYGIFLNNSRSNTIFHNNFFNNTNCASSTGSPNNVWDNGCEGNYWNDHNVTDLGNDGVGDNPYTIDEDNLDYYPLINPYWNPADVNHDLIIDIYDVVLVSGAYGSDSTAKNWNPHCDIAEPYEAIDIYDVVLICESYREEYVR